MTYAKPPISITDQISLMKSRGLSFPDENCAAHILEHISYYRLAAYLRPLESDKVTHRDIKKLMDDNPIVSVSAMGFPSSWKTEQLWQRKENYSNGEI